MKNLFIYLVVFLAACGQQRPSLNCNTYSEAEDPLPDSLSSWDQVPYGLHASIGSIDTRYPKSSFPEITSQTTWQGSGWRGERVSIQMILWSREKVPRIEIEFSEFKSEDGKSLPDSIARARFVRYVLTDEFADGCGKRNPEDYAVSLSADVLDNIACFDIDPNTARPVWLSIDIPVDAVPGTYSSTMQVFANGKVRSVFTFSIEVLTRTLPPPSEWEFHLDLWQNPYAVARVLGVEPWTDAHWKALDPLMKMLANAGQKVITTTLNKRPWGGQTQDPFDGMIRWIRKGDNEWEYDYTIFDNWVQFMMDIGINSQINCYSMVPTGNELYYFDEHEGHEVKIKADPGTKEYSNLWGPFLHDFLTHLEMKGWLDFTCIAMDERRPEEMQAMLKLIAEAAPGLGVALADNHKSYALYPDQLKDLCVSQSTVIESKDLQYRRSMGYISTWYVSCADEFPNVFTFSPPAEGAFIGWFSMAVGFDGFLRWAYNSWVSEPLLDSRFRTWPAGDTYIVYPDARSSIRFERLREGIQDYEKIRILREEFEKDSSSQSKKNLVSLNETVALFNFREDPGYNNLLTLLEKGKKELERLSKEE